MLKIPRGLFFRQRKSENNNGKSSDSALTDISEVEIPLTSIEDIGWVTNAIEPAQQRGPSESP
ncbi:hypothetical protein Desdi_1924 [Desulfitobacterium dichloroeliminans LMG P-21439]|uniref:Uncharacterized protein n=1 Tax=Desulfitobacterium dichloroeliminans (strain LMG P-21439 / DCA1) TaxID=871963 RepID=L0F8T8_DESDL|nr:hypothetical protein [Desulfitobacterium dichloroeliminans]AGA69373.1 hypothetical protein Desdi_1924 [Desulfitobacterium dichloroeliminans LMG P-21439]